MYFAESVFNGQYLMMSSVLRMTAVRLSARGGLSLDAAVRKSIVVPLQCNRRSWNNSCMFFSPVRTVALCHGAQLLRQNGWCQHFCSCPPTFIIPYRQLIRKASPRPHLQSKNVEDGLSPNFVLIYANNAIDYVQYGVPLLLGIVTMCTVFLITVVYNSVIHGIAPETKEVGLGMRYELGNAERIAYICLAVVPFAYVSVMSVCRTVVHRLYYNAATKEYAAAIMKYGLFKDKMKFTSHDVKVLPRTGSVRGNVVIKGKRCLMTEKDFTHTVHYNRLMGYDLGKESEYQKAKSEEDVFGVVVKGIEDMQKRKAATFEKKFIERRKKKSRRGN